MSTAVDQQPSRSEPQPLSRAARTSGDGGFTLIETLVVTLILGILAAMVTIALLHVRITAFDASARSDLRNTATRAATLLQGDIAAVTAADLKPPAPTLSPGVKVKLLAYKAGEGFCFAAQHESSTHRWYLNSRDGHLRGPGGSSGCPWPHGTGVAPGCDNGMNVGNGNLCTEFPGAGDRQAD